VSAPSFQGTLTGAITFTIDGHAEAPIQLTLVGASGDAAFSTSTLSAGSHTISASYSGDSNVSASSASPLTQTVNAPALQTSTTTLASSLNPSTAGQAVTFTAVVSPSGTAGAPSGSVTFTIDGVSKAPVPLQVVNGSDQATLSIASLAKGTHTITAAYGGDASFAASAVASPLVETVKAVAAPAPAPAAAGDGPKVELVQRFGVHMQPTVLVVTFNEALDPASAVNLRNYRITDPAGSSVRIRSAVFDAATNTVTLRPVDRINLHHTYQIRLVGTGTGGIRNTQGELLDGASTGSADGDYRGTLTWRNVVLTPAEALKYGHPSQAKPAGALHHRFLHRSH
jgi:Bacterial Ig-like domain (group 3)